MSKTITSANPNANTANISHPLEAGLLDPADPLEFHEVARSVRGLCEERFGKASPKDPEFRREDFDALAALGLSGMSIDEEYGGVPLGPLALALVNFEIARLQLGPSIYLGVHSMVSGLINRYCQNDYQISTLRNLASGKLLGAFCLSEASAGSDAASLQTKARRDGKGYRLSGEKIYITCGAVADLLLVFARTGAEGKDGISAFLVNADAEGLSSSAPDEKMGCTGAPIYSLHFDDVFVEEEALLGSEGQGYRIALSGLSGGRVNIAASACGIAHAALERSRAHLLERSQFGTPLAEFQGLQFMLADMVKELRAATLLTRDAALRLGAGDTSNSAASIAKCFSTDMAMKVTTDAVQLLGGAGYLKEYLVERSMRDAKMLQIVEGTNQIQRVLIAREYLKS